MYKEKALEIANKMYNGSVFDKTKTEHLAELENAKRCSVIAIDEILKNIEATIAYHKDSLALPLNKEYWTIVKEEIHNL